MRDQSRVLVKVKLNPGAKIPTYATPHASGADLYANEEVTLSAGERAVVGTGIALEIPPGYEGQIRPRSGLAANTGVTVLNAPGTIDSDYRGEVGVLLINLGDATVSLRKGDRIAQLVIVPIPVVVLIEVEELGDTKRGDGGFGSTGR